MKLIKQQRDEQKNLKLIEEDDRQRGSDTRTVGASGVGEGADPTSAHSRAPEENSPPRAGGAPSAAGENTSPPWKSWAEKADPELYPAKPATPWVERPPQVCRQKQYGSPKGGKNEVPLAWAPPQHSSVTQANPGKFRENGSPEFLYPMKLFFMDKVNKNAKTSSEKTSKLYLK